MYITFRSQGGIGEVAKEMGFGEDSSSRFACLNTTEGVRLSINSKEQLKLEFPKIFENVGRIVLRYKPFALSQQNLTYFHNH